MEERLTVVVGAGQFVATPIYYARPIHFFKPTLSSMWVEASVRSWSDLATQMGVFGGRTSRIVIENLNHAIDDWARNFSETYEPPKVIKPNYFHKTFCPNEYEREIYVGVFTDEKRRALRKKRKRKNKRRHR